MRLITRDRRSPAEMIETARFVSCGASEVQNQRMREQQTQDDLLDFLSAGFRAMKWQNMVDDKYLDTASLDDKILEAWCSSFGME